MARPLPMCAWCGGSLRKCAKLLVRWTHLPGHPEVGWHYLAKTGDCHGDEQIGVAARSSERDAPQVIAAIEARGAGRVARYRRRVAAVG